MSFLWALSVCVLTLVICARVRQAARRIRTNRRVALLTAGER
jgi:hypothetical protein